MAEISHARYYQGYKGGTITEYRVRIPAWWGSVHANQWNFDPGPGTPALPPGYRMRHLNLKSTDGLRRRNFPVSDPTPSTFPYIGETLTLHNIDGTTSTWTVVGYNAESYQPKKLRKKKR